MSRSLRSHHGRKIWSSGALRPVEASQPVLTPGSLARCLLSYPCNTHTFRVLNTLCTSSAYVLPLLFFQGVLPFPQWALLTRRCGWVGAGSLRSFSVSSMACMCVCERERESEWLKPTKLYTLTQPSSYADFQLESILPAWAPGATALSTGNVQRWVTKFYS